MNQDNVSIEDIFNGIENNEFVPYLHQITDKEEIIGVEVLSRWNSSKFGRTVPPFFFIDKISENPELSSIFTKVMYTGLIESYEQLQYAGFEGFISFNLSANDLEPTSDIPGFIIEITPPEIVENIILEVTSQHPIQKHHSEVSVGRAAMLKEHGFRLAIDDMGSARGFNVFDLLKKYISVVKIDKSFADTMADKNGVELERPVTAIKGVIAAVTSMSPVDDITFIIEGIEMGPQGLTQKEILKRENLEFLKIQGYIGGIPISTKEFIEEKLGKK